MKKTVTISVISSILCLVVGLYGGMAYQKSKQETLRQNIQAQFGGNTGMRNGTGVGSTTAKDGLMRGNAPVNGKIISMDATSISVQMQDGSNKIVLLSDQTKINKTTDAAKTDLAVGTQVLVIGNTTNGAVTAQTISIGGGINRQEPVPTSTTK